MKRAMTLGEKDESAAAPEAQSAGFAGWWLIAVLTLLYTLSFLDRHIISLMVDPIRASLGISEVQVGLLQGFSFAIFFGLAGIPLGIAADRLPRRKLIFWGAIAWTIAASASGLARNFWQLLLSRVGVGVAEATLLPAGYSLIASVFPKSRLGLAVSIFASGSVIGGATATYLGALIIGNLPPEGITVPVVGVLEPWQAAFIIAAAPCFLLAPLIFTVPGGRKTIPASDTTGFGPAFAEIRKYSGFYLCHFTGFGLVSYCGYATTSWLPTYLIREYAMPVIEVGAWLGFFGIAFGLLGTITIGWLGDYWFRRGRTSAHVLTPMTACFIQFGALIGMMLAPSLAICLFFIGLYYLMIGFHGAAAASLQIASPPHLRGRLSAIYLLVFIILGAGLGPFVTPAINEWIMPDTSRLGISIVLASTLAMPVILVTLMTAARGLRRIESDRAAAAG